MDFKERFRGKTAFMKKDGHIGQVRNSQHPITKAEAQTRLSQQTLASCELARQSEKMHKKIRPKCQKEIANNKNNMSSQEDSIVYTKSLEAIHRKASRIQNKNNPYCSPIADSQHRVQTVQSKNHNHQHLAASFYKRFHTNSQRNQLKHTGLTSVDQLPLLLDAQSSNKDIVFTSPLRKPPRYQFTQQKPRQTQNTSYDKNPYTLSSHSFIVSKRGNKARVVLGDFSTPEINKRQRITPFKEDTSPSSIQLSSLKGPPQANIIKSRNSQKIGTLSPKCNYKIEKYQNQQKVDAQYQDTDLSPYQRIKGNEGSQPSLFIQRNNTLDSAFRSRCSALLPQIQKSSRSFHQSFTETKRKQIIDSIVRNNRNCLRPKNP